MNIELHKRSVEYTLRLSRRARRMSLTIYHDGAFVVTAPPTFRKDLIAQFIIKKSRWIINKLDYYKKSPRRVFLNRSNKDFVRYKEAALILAKRRLEDLNSLYEFSLNKVTIKNQKTRWGSCSRKGNLNFNYKIALLPQHLADYIIVHELCHLGEFNHSRKFWELVARTVPDYREKRKELKENFSL